MSGYVTGTPELDRRKPKGKSTTSSVNPRRKLIQESSSSESDEEIDDLLSTDLEDAESEYEEEVLANTFCT